MGKRKFAAEILSNDTGGMYVIVPFDVEKEYGKKRVKIIAKIEHLLPIKDRLFEWDLRIIFF